MGVSTKLDNSPFIYNNYSLLLNFTNSSGLNATTEIYCGINPHVYLEAKFYLIAVVGTMIAVFGVFGNVTTTLILSRPSMRSPNNLFLTALAVFDTCLLVTAFFIYSMEYIIEFTESLDMYVAWLTYLRFVFALSHISQTGSVYTTVAVTVERYLAVVYPKHSKTVCTKHGAAASILCVAAFAIMFNCTKFFELEVVRNPLCPVENFQSYLLIPGALGLNPMYGTIYTLWLSNIVMVFFPFLCLLVLNSVIAIYIRNSLKRLRWAERISRHSELKEKSRDATLVLVVIVFIFLICNFWGFILTLYERIYGMTELARNYHRFYTFSREAVNFLAIINSSINFVIYCIFGKDFRKELVVVYGCGGVGMKILLPVGDRFALWRQRRNSRPPKAQADAAPNLANIGMRQFSEIFVKSASHEHMGSNGGCAATTPVTITEEHFDDDGGGGLTLTARPASYSNRLDLPSPARQQPTCHARRSGGATNQRPPLANGNVVRPPLPTTTTAVCISSRSPSGRHEDTARLCNDAQTGLIVAYADDVDEGERASFVMANRRAMTARRDDSALPNCSDGRPARQTDGDDGVTPPPAYSTLVTASPPSTSVTAPATGLASHEEIIFV